MVFEDKRKRKGLFASITIVAVSLFLMKTSAFALDDVAVTVDPVFYDALENYYNNCEGVEFRANYEVFVPGTCRENFAHLSLEDKDGERLTIDISALPELFPNLGTLSIYGYDIADADDISGLTKLWSLYIHDSDLRTIPDLTSLAYLNNLSLRNCGISDLQPLAGLNTLTDLALSENDISDSELDVIAGLTGLTRLDLDDNNITDISSLKTLTNLSGLHLYENDISNIDVVEFMPNLHSLNISKNNITDITKIASLTNLDSLYADENNISSIDSLPTSLRYLDISHNNISDISRVSQMANLYSLNATYNSITSIDSIKNLTQLYDVILSHNNISTIPDLSGAINLRELNLNYNSIEDIAGLDGLQSLEYLYLGGNKITNVQALGTLTDLKDLRLSNNNISDISTLADTGKNYSSFDLYLDDNPGISDYSALANRKISTLDLGNNGLTDDLLAQILTIDANTLYQLSLNNSPDITDFSGLSVFSNLALLMLRENNLEEIPDLSVFPGLMGVELSNNLISDISNIGERIPSNIMILLLQNNLISDVSSVEADFPNMYLMSLAGNMIEEIPAEFDPITQDDFEGFVQFIGQRLSLNSNGKTVALPKIVQQNKYFIDSVDNYNIFDGGNAEAQRALFLNALYTENLDLNADYTEATILDLSKPAFFGYKIKVDDFVKEFLNGGKGDSYDDYEDDGYDALRYNFGWDGEDEYLYLLRVSINVNANPNTSDSVVVMMVGFAAMMVVAGVTIRRYVALGRR